MSTFRNVCHRISLQELSHMVFLEKKLMYYVFNIFVAYNFPANEWKKSLCTIYFTLCCISAEAI